MKSPATHLRFPLTALPESTEALRASLRARLTSEREAGTWQPDDRSWGGWNPALSRALGDAGFIGMTWPKAYGGHERSYLERYVVTEELLAAGAPTAFHWVADRQSGPVILRFGQKKQKERLLPEIAAGRLSFCIGMSEPDSGSDLASIRTRAERDGDGWRLSGTKIWTSSAHRADWCIVLCRTEAPDPDGRNRHAGLSQMLVDLGSTGVTVRPVINLRGDHDFNEVVFEEVFVPGDCVLGEPGNGWAQVTSELAYERAGPERFLTNLWLLRELIDLLGSGASGGARRTVGALVSRLWTLRTASLSVAGMLERGELPAVESALVKDLGTAFQQALPEAARSICNGEDGLDQERSRRFVTLLERAIIAAPAYTIQGGTTEILRGIIARGLRLR